jgi:D-glycero-alpha-D-manno-heptose-7-phosphate kinase
VRIDSSAPTRIDLAGGTLDIWPLYLYHEGAQTLNAAISLRARCSLSPEPGGRIVIRSADNGRTIEARHWSELRETSELRLLGRLLHHFQVAGLRLETACESPMGAGIAGSSALNVAVCGALAAWTGRSLAPDALLQIAMNVEAQAIDVPTGAQDYRPAYYGGISAVELGPEGVQRFALEVDPGELASRIVLAYTGATRNSGINNWEITKRHIDGDREIFERFERIRDIAVQMRAALEHGDWTEVGRQLGEEWDTRKRLAPGVTTPEIDRMMAAARAAGAIATKICGAGGGGCMIAFAEPSQVPAVRAALSTSGATILPYAIESRGLVVEREAAAAVGAHG